MRCGKLAARKYGVRAAMPGFIGKKLCPDLIFVPPDFKKYTHYSDLTRKVFLKYDPNFVSSGLDEAYLDITEVCKERAISSVEIAEELRKCVYEETGLTCSAGVAPNRLLAKVCSDINKPNGQFVLPNDRMHILTFISSLPIRKIGGIGKVTERILSDVVGINTCEEMLQKCAFLCALFSRSSADFFLSVGLGLGKTDAPELRSRKSMSSERTFSATSSEDSLYQKLADIAATLSSDMEKEGLSGRTLTLKLKTASFEVRTRAVSLQSYINSREDILVHASKLLKAELPISLRLIGIRMSHFNDEKIGPVDPTQKRLTSFIIPGDASAKLTCSNNSMSANSVNSGRDPMDHTGTCLPIYSHNNTFLDPLHYWESEDPSSSNQLSDFEQMHDISSIITGEMEHEFISKQNDCQAEVPTADTTAGGVQMAKTNSFSGYSETYYGDRHNKRANISDEVNKKQPPPILWEDDYKCALCGAELPPSFVEERREHSDYHFAEMLQKEETKLSERDLIQRQRTSTVVQNAKESKRKKRKNNPKASSHLPIDMFFVKSSQNF
ncbi:hypothetical protein Scep_000521 [Stephania cephalantha]|uniref:DNA polymerase kappa n=1 Tax=Stephania cephalantha TaxID=152367 RepID=A0AAP0L909_9MAGN